MITAVIDYRNLLFLIYQDGKLQDNPLTGEVQRVVIEQVIQDVVNEIRSQVSSQLTDTPPGLKPHLIH